MNPQYNIEWSNSPYEGLSEFRYNRQYLSEEFFDEQKVYCLNEQVFYKLLNLWNRDPNWKYWA